VTNLTGHKLPTGYPEGRRMWLEVAIVDGTGAVTGGSGLYDVESATLTEDDQVRTYEVKLGEAGEPSFHFVLNDTVLLDNRIPPEGFDPPAELDMEPIGRDYGDGSGGYRHWDETSYAFAACGEGELSLRVRLLFQSTTREYIEFLRDNAPDSLDPDVDNWGAVAYAQWDAHGGRVPTVMAEEVVALGASPAACPEPPMDAGMPDAGTPMDSGTTPPPPDDGGCGCRTAGRAPEGRLPWALSLLVLSLALLRRRRRP
jgi:MYXO-CTERM domain-containing protein